ncbi:MAG: hypothetical protein ACXVJW_02835 [Acidimicrobiia bacterium]
MKALVLAAEGIKNRDLWYPTILGVLVVLAAVSLFMGSIYLLLATNLGSRLGFLIAAAGLSGFMVLLSCLWLTTASPLNTLKGRPPSWKAVESITGGDLSKSKIPAVRELTKADELTDTAEQANVKAALDQVVVTPALNPGSQEVGATSKFAIYQAATDYLVPTYYETGGGDIFRQVKVDLNGRFPLLHVSLHTPKYAVVNICPVDKNALVVPFGESPPTPKCDKGKPINSVVFERDLGSVRVPPFVALLGSSVLFALCLLSLHWRERDLQERDAALAAAADRGAGTAVERIPEKV